MRKKLSCGSKKECRFSWDRWHLGTLVRLRTKGVRFQRSFFLCNTCCGYCRKHSEITAAMRMSTRVNRGSFALVQFSSFVGHVPSRGSTESWWEGWSAQRGVWHYIVTWQWSCDHVTVGGAQWVTVYSSPSFVGFHLYDIGQKISVGDNNFFVCGKNIDSCDIFLVSRMICFCFWAVRPSLIPVRLDISSLPIGVCWFWRELEDKHSAAIPAN